MPAHAQAICKWRITCHDLQCWLSNLHDLNCGHAAPSDDDRWVLEVDLGAFRRGLPHMRRTKTIGQGVDFLNRHLSSSLSRDPATGGINGSLFEYLKTLTYAGTSQLA